MDRSPSAYLAGVARNDDEPQAPPDWRAANRRRGATVTGPDFSPAVDANAPMAATMTVEWRHGIGDVVSALTAAGLRLEFLHEHDHGHLRLHAGQRIPQVYSLRAAKAA